MYQAINIKYLKKSSVFNKYYKGVMKGWRK